MPNSTFRLGSLSAGTLRTEDLIPAFAKALEPGSELQARIASYDPKITAPDEADCLLKEIKEELGEIAPPFCSFGLLEGDGTDFGFWPEYDLIREAIAGGDLLQIASVGEIPADYDGQALRICDCGRMTLFAVVDGAAYEIWSTDAPNRA